MIDKNCEKVIVTLEIGDQVCSDYFEKINDALKFVGDGARLTFAEQQADAYCVVVHHENEELSQKDINELYDYLNKLVEEDEEHEKLKLW